MGCSVNNEQYLGIVPETSVYRAHQMKGLLAQSLFSSPGGGFRPRPIPGKARYLLDDPSTFCDWKAQQRHTGYHGLEFQFPPGSARSTHLCCRSLDSR